MIFNILAGIVLVYIFLIAPSLRRKNISSLYGWDYAHRGLHDRGKGIPENSMLAFKRAVVQGYGIELDVQKTQDGVLVVFHDDDLLRLCGIEKNVRDADYDQLKNLKLFSSEEGIPTFKQVLRLVDGRVPLIIEIKKTSQGGDELARQVYEELADYKGGYCVESFDPRLMRWFKKNAPKVIRGQLAMGKQGEGAGPPLTFVLKYMLLNFLSRPDFVAYEFFYDNNISLWLMKNFFRVPLVAWTVKDPNAYKLVKEKYQMQIFEGFLPNNELTIQG